VCAWKGKVFRFVGCPHGKIYLYIHEHTHTNTHIHAHLHPKTPAHTHQHWHTHAHMIHRHMHTVTPDEKCCSRRKAGGHNAGMLQRTRARAHQRIPTVQAAACKGRGGLEQVLGTVSVRKTVGRFCAARETDDGGGREKVEGKEEGKVDHPMSLAAAAASMRDCRRFESPPKERSTMSSF